MEQNNNKFVAVAYKLYTIDDEGTTLVEEAPVNKPFVFISGFGITLDSFEQAVTTLEKGAEFDFQLTPEQAYGEYINEHVIDLDKEIFTINGRFDHEHIVKDAIIPLQNEEGQRFMARVAEVSADKVKVDLNHPLAGKTLNFKGSVVESRTATNEEIQDIINRMSGRRACLDCGATYHIVTIPTKVEGICDTCGSKIVLREDDKPETVKNRLAVYHEQTQPLIEYYEKADALRTVDGTKDKDEVFGDIVAILG